MTATRRAALGARWPQVRGTLTQIRKQRRRQTCLSACTWPAYACHSCRMVVRCARVGAIAAATASHCPGGASAAVAKSTCTTSGRNRRARPITQLCKTGGMGEHGGRLSGAAGRHHVAFQRQLAGRSLESLHSACRATLPSTGQRQDAPGTARRVPGPRVRRLPNDHSRIPSESGRLARAPPRWPQPHHASPAQPCGWNGLAAAGGMPLLLQRHQPQLCLL